MRGVPFNVGLGAYPLVTLAKARRMSIDNARLVADGTDPRAERKRDAGIPTFKEASETVVGIHAQTWKAGTKTAQLWRSRLEEYAYPTVGEQPVSDVTSSDVLGILLPIWADKRATATKVRQYMSAIMKWAVVEGYRDDDPAGKHHRRGVAERRCLSSSSARAAVRRSRGRAGGDQAVRCL